MNNLFAPNSDFNRARDGRNAPDAYIDVDLSTVSDQFFNIAGNAFFADANPQDGTCVVYFQETDNLRGPTPFYVSPGFIARVPFTQIRVVNSVAQPGKKIRLIYGVDIDFQPGSVSQVAFNGEVSVNDVVLANSQVEFLTGPTVVGFTASPLILPAANINGIKITAASVIVASVAGATISSMLICAPTAPAVFNGTTRAAFGHVRSNNGGQANSFEYNMSRRIPAGWGIYSCFLTTVSACFIETSLTYQLL